MVDGNQLHLTDLRIQGFLGIDSLTIPRLGRVTLIAGKNGIGKTTVLDAVRLYAARGRYAVLAELLINRDEVYQSIEDDGARGEGTSILGLDWLSLFHRRGFSSDNRIVLGPTNIAEQLTIRSTLLLNDQAELLDTALSDLLGESPILALETALHGSRGFMPWVIPLRHVGSDREEKGRFLPRAMRRLTKTYEMPPELECKSLGPQILTSQQLALLWDYAADIKEESKASDALREIFGYDIIDITMVGDSRSMLPIESRFRRRANGRRPMVNMKGYSHRVPLRSLGDGAVRLFGVALALINSRDGFLLIDEAENGLHYSVQSDFWRMVLHTAQVNNVQVFATTHSDDCIKGFTIAAKEHEESEGFLVHLRQDINGHYSVEYDEEKLGIAAEQGIEVR